MKNDTDKRVQHAPSHPRKKEAILYAEDEIIAEGMPGTRKKSGPETVPSHKSYYKSTMGHVPGYDSEGDERRVARNKMGYFRTAEQDFYDYDPRDDDSYCSEESLSDSEEDKTHKNSMGCASGSKEDESRAGWNRMRKIRTAEYDFYGSDNTLSDSEEDKTHRNTVKCASDSKEEESRVVRNRVHKVRTAKRDFFDSHVTEEYLYDSEENLCDSSDLHNACTAKADYADRVRDRAKDAHSVLSTEDEELETDCAKGAANYKKYSCAADFDEQSIDYVGNKEQLPDFWRYSSIAERIVHDSKGPCTVGRSLAIGLHTATAPITDQGFYCGIMDVKRVRDGEIATAENINTKQGIGKKKKDKMRKPKPPKGYL